MAQINPYLNFDGQAEEALTFYRSIFGGDFIGGIHRFDNTPGLETLTEEEKNRVMHVALPIGANILMASDVLPSMGHRFVPGNNVYLSVQVDSREQADEIFGKLAEGGIIEMPLGDQAWGDYYGSLKDKFDIGWMVSYAMRQG